MIGATRRASAAEHDSEMRKFALEAMHHFSAGAVMSWFSGDSPFSTALRHQYEHLQPAWRDDAETHTKAVLVVVEPDDA